MGKYLLKEPKEELANSEVARKHYLGEIFLRINQFDLIFRRKKTYSIKINKNKNELLTQNGLKTYKIIC